jgi:hypothetical protein
MGKKYDRIDAYVGKAQAVAKPVLEHIRAVVHKTCPEVDETMKWGSPTFICGYIKEAMRLRQAEELEVHELLTAGELSCDFALSTLDERS